MFKSRIPLQTPIAVKILLLVAIAIFFVGWYFVDDASGRELNLLPKPVIIN